MAGNEVQEVAAGSVEVVGTARRRLFSEAFKRRIVDEAARARPGEIGLILRREGLYSSQLAQWRAWRSGVGQTKKHGPARDDLRAEYERVVKENARLKLKLRKAEAMLELQKKAAEILGYDDEKPGSDS
jgi:transposase-like protein